MPRCAHVAYSGPSGASELCMTLATAGQAAGTPQAIAFWGLEDVPADRLERCTEASIPTAVFRKARGFDLTSQRALRDWLKDQQPDVVFVHCAPALMSLLPSRKTRLVLVEHHSNALKSWRQWLLSLVALWFADGVVYLTEGYRAQVKAKLGPLFRAARTHVISNGLPLDRFQRPPGWSRSEPDVFTVGMASRMVPGKDQAGLIRAFDKIANPRSWRLELLGSGPELPALQTLVQRLGLGSQVFFPGMLSQDAMIQRLWNWDVAVLATRGETQPLGLMEAMACGLPCVASDAPGVRELAAESPGAVCLVPMSDSDALAGALQRLHHDPDEAATLAERAFSASCTRYSASLMWDNYHNLVE